MRAVLFKQQKRFVDLKLENGQEVVCFGRITLYEPRGEYQLVIDSIELHGAGRLQLQFEQLKEKLSQRGYFDAERKKEIPQFAKKIAVISSPTGAAIQDFLKIVTLRDSPAHILILPTRVQGDQAASQIEQAIRRAQSISDLEVIVLCRGGGSIEDLWAFNEERVADAIFHSKIPVVTGIGHETDFTIADFCADHRCPTPTGAAEKLIVDSRLLRIHLDRVKKLLINKIKRNLGVSTREVQYCTRLLQNFNTVIRESEHRLALSKSYFFQASTDYISARSTRLDNVTNRLQTQAPLQKIEVHKRHVENLIKELKGYIQRIMERKEQSLAVQGSLLNSVSPLATLGRGYSITRKYSDSGKTYSVVTKNSQVAAGDTINVLLREGELDCVVQRTNDTDEQ